MIQKMCELGMTNVVPFTSQYTNVNPKSVRLDRLEKIIISACKQCSRTQTLKISPPVGFSSLIEQSGKFDAVIFANEKEGKNNTSNSNFLSSFKGDFKGKVIALIVGPEGGFSDSEVKEIIKAGAQSVSLGKRILKAETAAIVLATLVMKELGELA
jgi:16S rRNA (uracil1498-N3)-methyltransferase